MVILSSGNRRMRLCLRVQPPRVLGLKVCTPTTWFLWQASVASGIKGVCPCWLVCKAGQWGCFHLPMSRQALFIKIQMKCHFTKFISQHWYGGLQLSVIQSQGIWHCLLASMGTTDVMQVIQSVPYLLSVFIVHSTLEVCGPKNDLLHNQAWHLVNLHSVTSFVSWSI